MSAPGTQLSLVAGAPVPVKQRSPLTHLLHALNQPLTGLQCSLELAAAGPRSQDQYVRVLRDGLELTGRMRILVEAIRELTDLQEESTPAGQTSLLNPILQESADSLVPMAEIKRVRLSLISKNQLLVPGSVPRLQALTFRLLESVLSLTRERGNLSIVAAPDSESMCLTLSWTTGPIPPHSPFSQAELGLLLAQAGWERLGADWKLTHVNGRTFCTICLPKAQPAPNPEELK